MAHLVVPRVSSAILRNASTEVLALQRIRPLHRPQHVRTIFYLPTVLQPAFWRSLMPSFLRRDKSKPTDPTVKRPRNPATFFIWISLLIGSQAIQLITLRKGFEQFTYETDQKLALLRDVVKRVKSGEDVDVEKELGTGDPVQEKQWDDVMKELQSEDAIFAEKKRAKRKREKREAENASGSDSSQMAT